MSDTQEISLCRKEIGCEPDVKGYRLLLKAPEIPNKTKAGIILPEQIKATERRVYNIGLVLKIGPTAFEGRFEDRRCNVGDWIQYSCYEREETYPNDKLCFYINDERVYSVIPPEDLDAFINWMR